MDGEVQIICSIRCDSEDTLRVAKEIAASRIRLDEEITRTFRTLPGGIERLEVRAFRLGDYFSTIEILESNRPLSFKLEFRIRPDAPDSYWKDLLAAVLRSISDNLPGVSARPVLQST